MRAAGEAALSGAGGRGRYRRGLVHRRGAAPTLFGRVIGADADGVALVPATSYGFAVAARNLPLSRRQRVLVLAEEYPSGIYTWRAATRAVGAEIVTVDRRPGQSWAEAILAVLDERVRCGQRAERALDRRRPRRPGGGRRPLPRNRGSARHRRQPVDRRHAAGRAALRPDFVVSWVTSGCSGRSESATSTSRESIATASRSSRTGSCAPDPRTSPAWSTTATTINRGAALRRRPAHQVRTATDGDRGAGTATQLADPSRGCDVVQPDNSDRIHRNEAGAGPKGVRSAWTAHAGSAPTHISPFNHPAGTGRGQLLRGRAWRRHCHVD